MPEALPSLATFGTPERIIEAYFSRVYLYPEIAVKVYRHGVYPYINLSDPELRRTFITDDFKWNTSVSPDIYRELRVLEVEGHEELCIIMKRLQADMTLKRALAEGRVRGLDPEAIASRLVQASRDMTALCRSELGDVCSLGFSELWRRDTESLRTFADSAGSVLNRGKVEDSIRVLESMSSTEPYFAANDPEVLSAALDTNTENIICEQGAVTLYDTMRLKREWRVMDSYFPIANVAATAEGLGCGAFTEAVSRAGQHYTGRPLSEREQTLYHLRSGIVEWVFRTLTKEYVLASAFEAYTVELIRRLRS